MCMLISLSRSLRNVHVYQNITWYPINMYDYMSIKNKIKQKNTCASNHLLRHQYNEGSLSPEDVGGTVLSVFHVSIYLISTKCYEVGTFINPILWTGKLRGCQQS
jgi:hypothetical protein